MSVTEIIILDLIKIVIHSFLIDKIIKTLRYSISTNKNTITLKKIIKSIVYTFSNLPLIIRLYRFSPSIQIKDIIIFEISNSLVIIILMYIKIIVNI
jgi:hypothetical protein